MPKWMLRKTFAFAAAHKLPNHSGKYQRLHGHEWVGQLVLESDQLQKDGAAAGMVLDFGVLKAAVESITDQLLDHTYLNDVPGLENPTCEVLARWLFDHLKPNLPQLVAIIINETPTSQVEYKP